MEAYEPPTNKPPLEAVTKGDEESHLVGRVLVGEANTEDSAVMLRRAIDQGERENINGRRSYTDGKIQYSIVNPKREFSCRARYFNDSTAGERHGAGDNRASYHGNP